MSTDTKGSPATTDTEPETKAQIEKAVESLRSWAKENEIPFETVISTLKGDEPPDDPGQPFPPFHTSVVWCDLFSPEGIKFHVVARGGATRATVLDTIFAASSACKQLLEIDWTLADRRPKTQEEIAATKAAIEEKMATSKATAQPKAKAKAQPKATRKARSDSNGNGAEEAQGRVIQVSNIRKMVTQNGNIHYIVQGGPWMKHGVMCWPDSGQIGKLMAVVDLNDWQISELVEFDEVDIKAVVKLKAGGKPDKVIDFVGDDALSDLPDGDIDAEIPY